MVNITKILELLKSDSKVDPEDILFLMDSYYRCPKDKNGVRLGPLVGYAGKYGPENKQYVGDVYLNFAPVEEYWFILGYLAKRLYNMLPQRKIFDVDVFCGAPEGGKALALALSSFDLMSRYVYSDIKVTAPATSEGREKRELIWGRHQVNQGDKVAIVEDLNNNFSTTDELIRLIIDSDAKVVAIVSFYNRSVIVTQDTYKYKGLVKGYCEEIYIPIITLKTNPISQYRQEDISVGSDVAKGNVVWKPKPAWEILKKAMESAKNRS